MIRVIANLTLVVTAAILTGRVHAFHVAGPIKPLVSSERRSGAIPARTWSGTSYASSRLRRRSSNVPEMVVPVGDLETMSGVASAWHTITNTLSSPILLSEDSSVGYSKFSYYTTLGLYALSFPGLWSVVKRATKTKYKDADYILPGPASTESEAESLKQTAAKIIAYFQANNYKILEAGKEITFEGAIQASKGQAFFLVFCTALSFATLALVLQIQFPAIGNYWFLLTLLSPYAGVYYWQNANRKDRAKVRLEASDDDRTTELYITAAEEELDRLSKTMGYMEKGKVRIKGLLETEPVSVPVPAAQPTQEDEPARQEAEY